MPIIVQIEPGQQVRSYDFYNRRDCYVEGKVQAIVEREGCLRYEIAVTCQVVQGNEKENRANFVYPPVNGLPGIFGVTCGVEPI